MCHSMRQNRGNQQRHGHDERAAPMIKHREIKLELARLMDSPEWSYLSEDDVDCINKLSGVVVRHPWPSYLQMVKRRIAIRMKERRLHDGR